MSTTMGRYAMLGQQPLETPRALGRELHAIAAARASDGEVEAGWSGRTVGRMSDVECALTRDGLRFGRSHGSFDAGQTEQSS